MTGIPPYFAAPLIPGLANNQILDAEQARSLLAQVNEDYRDPAKRPAFDAYLNQVIAEEAFVTPRRLIEISGAARQFMNATPEQIAQQKMREQGHAADLNELPAAFRADLDRMGGVTETDVAEFAQMVYKDLPKKEAIAKYLDVVKRNAPNGVAAFTRPLADTEGRLANTYGQ